MNKAKATTIMEKLGQGITSTSTDLDGIYLRLLTHCALLEISGALDDFGDPAGKTPGELRERLDGFFMKLQDIAKKYEPQEMANVNPNNLTEETAKRFNRSTEQLLEILRG